MPIKYGHAANPFTKTMEQLQALKERVGEFAKSACSLMNKYDERYQVANHVGAIVFDNLRPVYKNIDRQLLRASTRNEKLVCILDNYQDEILTLKDFMSKIYDESHDTQQDNLKRSIGDVIGNLSSSLYIIAFIKHNLGDQRHPVSRYKQRRETLMTERVAAYLPAGTSRELVYAVRNYVISREVILCAETMFRYFEILQHF